MANVPNNPIYFPLLASENLTRGTKQAEEIRDVWSRFSAVSDTVKNLLTSDELPIKMAQFQTASKLDDGTMEGVSVLLRWFFFGQVDRQGFESGVTGLVEDNVLASKVLDFIQKDILTIKPASKAETTEDVRVSSRDVMSLPLLQALSKYESLGNQIITNERIRIKSQVEPVRPSLLYWLKYYRDELGIGHHDSVQRGQFLFRSENGKRLSTEERERVNLILRSVEEDYPLQIDVERGEIVFPAFKNETATSVPREISRSPVDNRVPERAFQRPQPQPTTTPASPQERAAPRPDFSQGNLRMGQGTHFGSLEPKSEPKEKGSLSFSSSHVFPAEKERTEVREPKKAPVPAEPHISPPTNPFHIRPVSLSKHDNKE